MTDNPIIDIRKTLRRLVLATVVLYLALGGIALKSAMDSHSTHSALCTLRGDLQVRVTSSLKFLSDNPRGLPGIPVQVIRDSIANQQRTILALDSLNC